MGFFSLQTTQFIQVLISERHAVIRSICAQLPLFRSAMTHVVVLLQPYIGKMPLYGFSVDPV